jgi:hypothetical protein
MPVIIPLDDTSIIDRNHSCGTGNVDHVRDICDLFMSSEAPDESEKAVFDWDLSNL